MGTTTPLSTLGATPNVEEEEDEDEEDDGGDESLEGDEDGDDEAGCTLEIDEDEKARLAQLQGAREDIVELERQLASVQAQLAIQVNPILRKRLDDNTRKLMAELQLRKSAIEEAEDD
jgi:transcription initiation factor TFIID subunit 7